MGFDTIEINLVLDFHWLAKDTGRPKNKELLYLLNFSGYKHAKKLVHILFQRWDPYLRLEYKTISVWYQGAEI